MAANIFEALDKLVLKCKVTGNQCGTDTWAVINGRIQPCMCDNCQIYMKRQQQKEGL